MRCAGFYNALFRPLCVGVLLTLLGTAECGFAQTDPDRAKVIQYPAVQNPSTFPMPGVVGLTVRKAEDRVLAAGRNARARSARAEIVGRRTDARPAGQIVEQLNPVGSPMRPYLDDVGGRYGEVTFRVIVSTGPQLAPDFLRREVGEAQLLARRQKVILTIADPLPDPTTPSGLVVRQEPAPGQPMSRRQVTVWPSAGYPLPNYVNRPLKDAQIESQKLGFGLEPRREANLKVPRGTIFAQQPPPGTSLPLRGPVMVTVSSGWPVPDFVGRNEREADAIAAEIRARLRKTERDNFEVPAGIVFAQKPAAQNPLPPDRVIDINVSRGYPLPDLVGKHESEARQIALELKLRLESSREAMPDRRAGHVDRQSPEAGARLPFDGPVRIVVSDGWPTPDFLTLEETEANTLAREKQVNLAISERRQDRATQPGIVIAQNPQPGKPLPPGQAVNLVVSTGYPTPRFIGLTEADAKTLAGREGIVLETTASASLDFDAGTITGQSPEPGAPLPTDNRVSAAISSGWPTPDFIGQSEEGAQGIASTSRITLVRIAPREDFELLPGLVVAQLPAAGTMVPAHRRVEISLSLGWPVAPDAVGRPARSVEEEFLASWPNAHIDFKESILTLEPAGTVVSQHPEPKVKLGRDQRLQLVASGEKPPWTWPAIGLFALTAAVTAFRWPKGRVKPDSRSFRSDDRGGDPGGIRLRVTRDPGVQTTAGSDDERAAPAEAAEIVKIKVTVDLGEQSAGPVDDEGD